MLDNTSTSGGALAAEVIRNGDAERSLVGWDGGGRGGVGVPRDQGSANNRVCRGVDDGDVGGTRVRSADVELDVDLLSGGIGLDIVLVVVVLETLAEPDVTLGGFVVALSVGNL